MAALDPNRQRTGFQPPRAPAAKTVMTNMSDAGKERPDLTEEREPLQSGRLPKRQPGRPIQANAEMAAWGQLPQLARVEFGNRVLVVNGHGWTVDTAALGCVIILRSVRKGAQFYLQPQ